MKFRILATVALLLVLIGLAFVYFSINPPNPTSAPSDPNGIVIH